MVTDAVELVAGAVGGGLLGLVELLPPQAAISAAVTSDITNKTGRAAIYDAK